MIYFPTAMAPYSLFVLKVPLNTKQTNKQTVMLKVLLNPNEQTNQPTNQLRLQINPKSHVL